MLGKSSLGVINSKNSDIKDSIPYLEDCQNTFSYVYENLASWADETTIGKQLRDDLARYNRYLNENLIGLKKVTETLDDFVETQTKYNNGQNI